MSCSKWRRLMLTAEPAELRGEGSGPLAAHVRECDGCGRAAERTLRGEESLSRAIGLLAEGRLSFPPELRSAPPSRRPRRWAWVQLAAAAAVAALLAQPWGREPQSPLRRPGASTVASSAAVPVPRAGEPDGADVPVGGVEVTRSERDFALISTENPNVSVVWFF